VLAAVSTSVCGGGSSPVAPGPTTPPPAPNTPPVIESFTASVERVEVGEEVTLTAVVRDAETPLAQLRFEWSAPGGGVTAAEPGVARWRPSAELSTPADYQVTVTVVETYGTGGTAEHRVAGTSPHVRVHHSVRELSELATRFLQEFSTSSIPPETVIRDFSDTCPGKQEELGDVQRNRDHYVINSYSLGTPQVSVRPGGGCSSLPYPRPARSPPADACITVQVEWHSTERATDGQEVARGTSVLSGVYHERRWWLCDSQFAAPASAISPMFTR
jgi:hypothetical protein